MLLLVLSMLAPAIPRTGAAVQPNITHLNFLGTFTPSQASPGSGTAGDETPSSPSAETPHNSGSPPGDTATAAPNPTPTPISTSNENMLVGWNALNHVNQRFGSTAGKNQFSLEPPDQGLAVGNGFVVEAVNTIFRVYSTSGASLTPTPIALNQFFGLPPEVNRVTTGRGNFTSDPKVYFDWQTGHFFMTLVEIDVIPFSVPRGQFAGPANQLLAVTQTSDPTGTWNLYFFPVQDDGTRGTPAHLGCPCFGDQPLIGADANGFYISTNEFPLFVNGFNGPQIYAMSKTQLAEGVTNPIVVAINAGAIPTPDAGGIWYSVQPATSPPGAHYARGHGGTEYFLSALQFFSDNLPLSPDPIDNRIAVWALTGTRSLDDATPSLTLSVATIRSETYGQPNPASQKPGPTTLGPLEFLNSNDDRMNQVVYADGLLWSGVNTLVQPVTSNRVAIAWFAVAPFVRDHGQVGGVVVKQGYIAPAGESALFPSIGVNADGQGVITFTLVGPDYFPSTAYALINEDGTGKIHIAGPGVAPEDGFSGVGSLVARWGDYTAAVSDEHGNIWIATEMIPGPRTALANWGTFIAQISPED